MPRSFTDRVDELHTEFLSRVNAAVVNDELAALDDLQSDYEHELTDLIKASGSVGPHPFLRPAVHSERRRRVASDLVDHLAA